MKDIRKTPEYVDELEVSLAQRIAELAGLAPGCAGFWGELVFSMDDREIHR